MATLTMPSPTSTEKSMSSPLSDLQSLTTELANEASAGLDTKSAIEIARIIAHEDAKVAAAVKKALPEIAIVIDTVARSLRDGGRLIYVGAGSSGRIASLDASECPPTYSTAPAQVQYIMAGRPQSPRLRIRRQRRLPRDRPARHSPPPSHPKRHRHRRLRQRPHPLRRRCRRI